VARVGGWEPGAGIRAGAMEAKAAFGGGSAAIIDVSDAVE